MEIDKIEIDRSKITPPTIQLTLKAKKELALIIENDPTTPGLHFRLQITGKGCDGFTYSCGFDQQLCDDFILDLSLQPHTQTLPIAIDPFTAFYLQDGIIDFVQEFATSPEIEDQEGFVIINKSEEKFRKKFWLKQNSLVPPLINSLSP